MEKYRRKLAKDEVERENAWRGQAVIDLRPLALPRTRFACSVAGCGATFNQRDAAALHVARCAKLNARAREVRCKTETDFSIDAQLGPYWPKEAPWVPASAH